MPTIHETIEEQTSLAQTYAEDGAFHSAARVLRQLAMTVGAHADWCTRQEVLAEQGREEYPEPDRDMKDYEP